MSEFLWTWAYFTVGMLGFGAAVMGLVVLVMASFVVSPWFVLLLPVATLALVLSCVAAMWCLDRAAP